MAGPPRRAAGGVARRGSHHRVEARRAPRCLLERLGAHQPPAFNVQGARLCQLGQSVPRTLYAYGLYESLTRAGRSIAFILRSIAVLRASVIKRHVAPPHHALSLLSLPFNLPRILPRNRPLYLPFRPATANTVLRARPSVAVSALPIDLLFNLPLGLPSANSER